MIDILKLEARTFVLGEIKNIGLRVARLNTDETISSLTASVTIYNSAGAIVVGTAPMTLSGLGTSYVSAIYLLATGAGQSITAAGTYRATYAIQVGSETQIFQQNIQVLSDPF